MAMISIQKPVFIGKDRNGNELYINPKNNKVCSREIAFGDFEGLKNQAKTLVYQKELSNYSSAKQDHCPIEILENTKEFIVKGKSSSKPSLKKSLPIDYTTKKSYKRHDKTFQRGQEEYLKELPYLPFLKKVKNNIFIWIEDMNDQLIEEEETLGSGCNSNQRHKQRKKRFSMMA